MSDNIPENRLIKLAELLFMPMVFYILTQWDKVQTWQGKVLWFLVFILVQNECLSVKDSYRKYSVWLYLCDFLSLFMYLFALKALTKSNPAIGYDPKFWIYLSVLWLGYAFWDFIMSSREEDQQTKEKLKLWGKLMILAFVVTMVCGLGLSIAIAQPESLSNKTIMSFLYICQFIPLCFILWSLYCWFKDMGVNFRNE